MEKFCIIVGPEFGPFKVHHLLVDKALYGLQSSGARWHDEFSMCMCTEGFFPCRAEPDIWMRPADGHYEYVAVYVDDIAFAVNKSQEFVAQLSNKHNFKLKGTGPIDYHLGANFSRDMDGTLCMSPKKYIVERLASSYLSMFGEKPKTKCKSPLERGDHPETDTSELLDVEGIQQYHSLIGSLQWVVTLS